MKTYKVTKINSGAIRFIPLKEGEQADFVLVIDGDKMTLNGVVLVDPTGNYEDVEGAASGDLRKVYPRDRWGEVVEKNFNSVKDPDAKGGWVRSDPRYSRPLAPNSLYCIMNGIHPQVYPAVFELLVADEKAAWNHVEVLAEMNTLADDEYAGERIRRVIQYAKDALKKRPWLRREQIWAKAREEILGKEPENLAEYAARLFLEDIEEGSL